MVAAVLVALMVGCAIGVQALFIDRLGSELGNFRSSLAINFAAGTLAAGIILLGFLRSGSVSFQVNRTVILIALFIGVMSIVTLTGFAHSLQVSGIAVTLAAIITGQLVVGTLVDTLGLFGVEPIALTGRRLLGIVALGIGLYLLLPENQ